MSSRRLPESIRYSPVEVDPYCRESLPWTLQIDRCALLIHDMQRHFLAPFAAKTIDPVIAQIQALRDRCDALEIPVFYSIQPARQSDLQRGLLLDFWGPGLQDQPERAKVIDALEPKAHHHCFEKWRYSAFAKTALASTLAKRGRDQLIVSGVYGHIGCHATVRDAFMQDIQAFAVGDALADFSAEELKSALRDIALRCGVVTSCARVLEQLEAPAGCENRAQTLLASAQSKFFFLALIEQEQPELPLDAELFDLGVDSVRWMQAIDHWNQDRGDDLAWEKVAACESIAQLCELLLSRGQG